MVRTRPTLSPVTGIQGISDALLILYGTSFEAAVNLHDLLALPAGGGTTSRDGKALTVGSVNHDTGPREWTTATSTQAPTTLMMCSIPDRPVSLPLLPECLHASGSTLRQPFTRMDVVHGPSILAYPRFLRYRSFMYNSRQSKTGMMNCKTLPSPGQGKQSTGGSTSGAWLMLSQAMNPCPGNMLRG